MSTRSVRRADGCPETQRRGTVALALAFNVAILTGDYDFLGCGCPTWGWDV
jgi:hypothetical protein